MICTFPYVTTTPFKCISITPRDWNTSARGLATQGLGGSSLLGPSDYPSEHFVGCYNKDKVVISSGLSTFIWRNAFRGRHFFSNNFFANLMYSNSDHLATLGRYGRIQAPKFRAWVILTKIDNYLKNIVFHIIISNMFFHIENHFKRRRKIGGQEWDQASPVQGW